MSPGPIPAPARSTPEAARATTGRVSEPTPESQEPAPEDVPSFPLRLGGVVREVALEGEHVTRTEAGVAVDLRPLGLSIPGVRFTRLGVRMVEGSPSSARLSGRIEAPFVRGDATVDLQAQSDGTVSGGAEDVRLQVGLLNDPTVDFTYTTEGWSGATRIEAGDLADRIPIPHVSVEEGSAEIRFDGASLSGRLEANLRHAALGSGRIHATLGTRDGEGTIEGGGSFSLTVPLLEGAEGSFQVSESDLSAELELSGDAIEPPVPGLTLDEVTGRIALAEGRVSGTFGLSAAYRGLATLTLEEASFTDRGFGGAAGQIVLVPPYLDEASSRFRITRDGRLTGRVRVAASELPVPALRSGGLTVALREDGGVDVSGEGRVVIGPVGQGDFRVSWEEGVLSLGADAEFRVPHLEPVRTTVEVVDGRLEGEAEAGAAVGPLSGTVHLVYRGGEFSGSGRLDYALGRFDGWVGVEVDPRGNISGSGQATFQVADWLSATIGLVVRSDLNVDAEGELTFPEEVEVFPAWEFEKQFFRFEQEFPLWGITVPVVGSIGLIAEVHANAGFRSNFGPGTLRNIAAEGEVSTDPEAEPRFSITGDFFIPAGAEIVLTVGGGIGLAALVAKISGGIDMRGIAGVYGAITLTPTFAYREGDYLLRGEALLQAAAQLRAGINAYARLVAGVGWLSGEVWREDWNLAEWRFDTGWNVGVKAGIDYVLGEPFQPEIDFEEVDVDPTALIKEAVPKSGEPVSASPVEPEPQAEFRALEGEAGAVRGSRSERAAPAGGGRPGGPGGAEAGAPGGGAAFRGARTGGGRGSGRPGERPERAREGVAAPRIEPPVGWGKEPENRTIEEAYLAYVYDQVSRHVRRMRRATAAPDEKLEERSGAGEPDEQQELLPATEGRESTGREAASLPESGRGSRDTAPGSEEVRRMMRVESSAGRPLAPATRREMEAIFEADLSEVRVHTDEAASSAARRVGAEAFTEGPDVYFGSSRQPESGDRELLAHELTHVVQESGDGTATVSQPHDELEKEAEEAARAVKRGEQPKPLRKRKGTAGLHRAEGATAGPAPGPTQEPARTEAGEGRAAREVAQGEKVPLTLEAWGRLRREMAVGGDRGLGAVVRQVLALPKVRERAAAQTYDEDTDEFVERTFVPMRFPGPRYLSHKNVFRNVQIEKGDYLVRNTKSSDDKEQSRLARLMYAERVKDDPWKDVEPEAGRFSRGGGYDMDGRWEEYRDNHVRKETETSDEKAPYDTFDVRDDQKYTSSRRNLSLSRAGYESLWNDGWVYFPSRGPAGGWERKGQSGAEVRGEPGSEESTDAATRDTMVADYQSHHVIPLWLRSEEGKPDGDQLANLVPWHRNAHQTNHAYHHDVPDDVEAVTGVSDYRDFEQGVRFLLHETTGGNMEHPSGTPAVKLEERSEEDGETRPATRYAWAPAGGSLPPWLS